MRPRGARQSSPRRLERLAAPLLELILWLALSIPAAAGQPTLFAQANQAYLKGAYARAAQLYREQVRQGPADADLFYNLGNAYYRLHDWGRARAAYERARMLAPRDADLANNLALLKTKLVDREPPEGSFQRLSELFTHNELAVLCSGFWFLSVGLLIWGVKRRHELILWAAAGAACGLLLFGGLLARRLVADSHGYAVVIPARVLLKNGPGRDYTDSIPLHAGTEVRILRSDGDWLEVAALERVRGWVRSEVVEQVGGPDRSRR